VQRLAYILGDKGRLEQPEDLAGMERVAQHFYDREIDVLCINGGDGTGHVVLSAMAAVYGDRPLPKLAMLRGGTMNTVANSVGIKGRPSQLLARVVRMYHEGVPFALAERNLLCVDGRHYGFLFGNGLAANFLELYYKGSEPTPWKAAWVLFRVSLSALVQGRLIKRVIRPVRARVSVDDKRWPAESFITVSAGTVDELGLGFRTFYGAPSHPGHLHALGFACTAPQIVKVLPRVRRALPTNHPDIHDSLCRTLRIESDGPQTFHVDGDFHTGGQVVMVEVGPRVQLIVG